MASETTPVHAPPRITRKLEFDSGHRLQGHESKCRNVHGHRYVAEVMVEADHLDEVGRVIDFGKVKELVGGWLDDRWDHGFLYEAGDPIALWLVDHDQKMFQLDAPPTAENLVVALHRKAAELLAPHDIRVVNVRLYETPNCWADSNSFLPMRSDV